MNKTLKQKYDKGIAEREKYLEIARDNSEVTIPYVYPPTDHAVGEELDRPYQSMGGRGVSHLSAQLLNILFPTDRPYFRLSYQGNEAMDLAMEKQVEDKLAEIEKLVVKEFDKRALRSSMFNALRILLIGGTVVLSNLDDNFRVLKLNQFVIKRRSDKKLDYVVIKDKMSRAKVLEIAPHIVKDDKKEEFDLYTIQYLEADGRYKVCQDIEDERVTEEYFDKAPILVVTTNIMDHENYGRSYCEEYQGDLFTLERLSEAIAQTASIAAKSVYLVDPGGLTRGRDLARANHGDVISGRVNDVHVLQSEKGADLSIVFQHTQELKERLSKAFLMASEGLPDRQITATEAKARVSEVEASLGGIYSMLSQTLQLPFIELIIKSLEDRGRIPELPEGVDTNIITGLDLLDRKTKVVQISEFLQFLGMFGEAGMQFIDPLALLEEVARGLGLDATKVLRPPEQPQQQPNQAMMQMMQQAMQGAQQGVAGGAAMGVEQMMAQAMQGGMGQPTPEETQPT